MNRVSAQEVRTILLQQVEPQLASRGMTLEQVPDDFDLLEEGVLDSMGIIQLITAIESHFDITVDFEGLDPEYLTIVGPLSRYFERMSGPNGTGPS